MSQYLRPNIRAMAGYTPGEQPQTADYVKLNTNENPYPPSPRALEAMSELLRTDRLRKYPDPLGAVFRVTAGTLSIQHHEVVVQAFPGLVVAKTGNQR